MLIIQKTTIVFKCKLVLIFLILCSNYTQSQENKDRDSLLISSARELITSSKTCALITVDENNIPAVRTMDPFMPDEDFNIWFGTNPHSRKVAQIRNNPNVTLYYLDKDTTGYVVVHGRAELVEFDREHSNYWKEEWEAFYPNPDKDYMLIKVIPTQLEIISESRNILGDSKTWKAPVVLFN